MSDTTTGTGPHWHRVATDHALIAAAREGDSAAFTMLLERDLVPANALARHFVGPTGVYAVVTEAASRVWQHLLLGEGPHEAFRPYLLVTVRRIHHDRGAAGLGDFSPYDHGVPADEPVAEFDRQSVRRAFAKLPDRSKVVLWHTEIESGAAEGIAQRYGLAARSVRELVLSAREGLRQAYLGERIAIAQDQPSHSPGDSTADPGDGRGASVLGGSGSVPPGGSGASPPGGSGASPPGGSGASPPGGSGASPPGGSGSAVGATCQSVQPKLGTYLRNALAPDDRAQLSAHVAECPRCAHLLKELHTIEEQLPNVLALSLLGLTAGAYRGLVAREAALPATGSGTARAVAEAATVAGAGAAGELTGTGGAGVAAARAGSAGAAGGGVAVASAAAGSTESVGLAILGPDPADTVPGLGAVAPEPGLQPSGVASILDEPPPDSRSPWRRRGLAAASVAVVLAAMGFGAWGLMGPGNQDDPAATERRGAGYPAAPPVSPDASAGLSSPTDGSSPTPSPTPTATSPTATPTPTPSPTPTASARTRPAQPGWSISVGAGPVGAWLAGGTAKIRVTADVGGGSALPDPVMEISGASGFGVMSGDGWSCSAGGSTITCSRGSLPLGTSKYMISLKAPNQRGSVTLTVRISGQGASGADSVTAQLR